MPMKRLLILTLALGFSCFSVLAQDQPAAPQPSTEEQEKEKAVREQNAYRLLDQIIDETQSLRLAENRVRVQIIAGDMLWDQNQARARSLFSMAAESVAELGRTQSATITRRGNGISVPNAVGPQNLRSYQLRQELVLTAAKHDAALAYQLLAITKPPLPPQTPDGDVRGNRPSITSDDSLEQTLLGRVAALDPKLAAQNAEQMLDKGQFPFSLPQVIDQLAKQDPDAATKLADKMVKRLQTANLLGNSQAGSLVQIMLMSGPRPAGETADSTSKQLPRGRGWPAVLDQSTYVDLLSTVIDSALKATPAAQNNQRGQRPGLPRPNQAAAPTDAQTEQNNARRLLASLQSVLPMIDQYVPAKASAVRQKMTEMGMPPNPGMNMAQMFNGNAPTIDALVQAAASAPQQMQARIYQQAAFKALEEGDTDRARQIATDHLQSNDRDTVMKRIDFREMSKKAETARIEDVRQAAARLQSDNEKLDLLIQVANDAQKSNPKLALQVLEDARQITNHRATGYDHFEQQLKVAHAFAAVDPARSFEVIDPGISHLNELLSAAAILSGFEINMFRDGEMTIMSGNGLTSTIGRYGQELALLAKNDFERSEALSGRFQFPEARIMVRMAIVQGLLGTKPAIGNIGFGTGGGGFIRQE